VSKPARLSAPASAPSHGEPLPGIVGPHVHRHLAAKPVRPHDPADDKLHAC